jgi:hypothetical protein
MNKWMKGSSKVYIGPLGVRTWSVALPAKPHRHPTNEAESHATYMCSLLQYKNNVSDQCVWTCAPPTWRIEANPTADSQWLTVIIKFVTIYSQSAINITIFKECILLCVKYCIYVSFRFTREWRKTPPTNIIWVQCTSCNVRNVHVVM